VFRFSVRDLFWLVALVAVGLGAGLCSFRYGKDAGRCEVMSTLEDGHVSKWDGDTLYVFKNGEWHRERPASLLFRPQEP
jgi:hypothetical protein